MNKNVPKLRFKGFEDEWKEHDLGSFLDFYTTNSLSRDCLNYESGEIKNIHYGDIHMKFQTILDVKKYELPFINNDIDVSKIKEESFCKDGDIIVADASEDYNDIGKTIEVINVRENKVVSGLHTILARDNKNLTAKRFKGYMLSNDTVRKQIKILAVGAKVLGISKSNLSKVNVKFPTLQEQEKIANFLTKVDSIIEKQDKKVEYWNSYKKGMMQKIFSQKIRFKDDNGCDYSEWEEKNLGDYVIEYIEKTTVDNQYPVLTSSRKGIILQSEYFKERQVTTNSNIGYFVIPRGFITFRSRSDDGTFVFNQNNIIDKGIISYFYPVFTFNDKMNNYYATTYMNNYLKKEIFKEVVGTSQLVLSMIKLKKLKVKYPCLEEQNKISNFLLNIDNIIEKENEKLEELRQWKKGLLQQMFV